MLLFYNRMVIEPPAYLDYSIKGATLRLKGVPYTEDTHMKFEGAKVSYQ
jgi:hypothetical protein